MSFCVENANVTASGFGVVTSAYVPAASFWPSTQTSSADWNCVISLAPVRHALPQGTRPPQTTRFLTPGRE